MLNKGLFSSKKSEWETPQELFDKLDAEFHFTLDVCASPKNTKCDNFIEWDEDGGGLKNWISWGNISMGSSGKKNVCWMNPPYGRHIGKWVEKAYRESLDGAMVVCLLPAKTDTKWWHNYCMRGEIRFLKGRVSFIAPDNRDKKPQLAPFPNAIVIFKGQTEYRKLNKERVREILENLWNNGYAQHALKPQANDAMNCDVDQALKEICGEE